MARPIRVALVQDVPRGWDIAAGVASSCQALTAAADQGAQVVVFPEAYFGGYPKGADFGARVGSRSDAGRELYRLYAAGAIDSPHVAMAPLLEICAQRQLVAIVGFIERHGGTLYCATITIDANGAIVGRRRKLVPTGTERLIWGRGDGSMLHVTPTAMGRVGVAICWENYMPLLRATYYAQQVEFYIAPTVDDRDSWAASMRHLAIEGRCFVLSVAPFARYRDFPDWFVESLPEIDRNAVAIRGGSCIVSPLGKFLVDPVFDRAALVVADCDLDDLARGRLDLDVAGHYGRPDLFRLAVDRRPQTAIEFLDDDTAGG